MEDFNVQVVRERKVDATTRHFSCTGLFELSDNDGHKG